MTNLPLSQRLLKGDLAIAFYFSLVNLVLHLVLNIDGGYGLFRDEFYYVACARNLAAGYVDQPPLCAFLLRGIIGLFGDSLFSIRLIPAIAGALTVFCTALITMRMGGKRLAVFISCLLSFSGINLVMFSFYSMNSIDILLWTFVAYIIIRIIQEENKMLWIWLGIVLGFGLLNKVGVLFLGAGIFAGLIFTMHRKWFATPWPYVAGAIAFIMFLPYIFWNVQNDLAHLEFIRNASREKYSSQSTGTFIAGQMLFNNPLALFVWLPGLVALFAGEDLKRYKVLGWIYVTAFLIFVINGTSKAEYLAPAYGMLYAAGAVFWERLVHRFRVMRFALGAVIILWIAVTLIFLPMLLPVLSVKNYISYSDALNFKPPSSEGKEQSELPQFYADMFGWKEKAQGVAKVYNSLSDSEKKECAIFASNYGRCGSLDYYGPAYGLPKTIGNHNNYWIWGPRGYTGEIMIILGGELSDHQPDFEKVELVSTIDCTYCMPYEDNMPVFLCRGMKRSLRNSGLMKNILNSIHGKS